MRKAVGVSTQVEDVSLPIREQETFGLVGESGCNKSTTGRNPPPHPSPPADRFSLTAPICVP